MNTFPEGYATVATFAKILGKKLSLVDGKEEETIKGEIRVPFKHKHAYTMVERQLAGLIFGGPKSHRDRFVKQFVGKTSKAALKLEVPTGDFRDSSSAVSQIIDILECHRVESLWGSIYLGSYQSMKSLARDRAVLLGPVDTSLTDFIQNLEAGVERGGPYQSFRPIVRQALAMVERKSFGATLVAARWIFSRMSAEALRLERELSRQEPAHTEELSASSKLEGLRALLEILRPNNLIDVPEAIRQGADSDAFERALTLDLSSEEDLSNFLDRCETKAERAAESLRKQLKLKPISRQDPIQGLDTAFKIELEESRSLKNRKLSWEDKQAALRLRHYFMRISALQSYGIAETGIELDMPAYIESVTSGSEQPFFRVPVNSRGFHLQLLVDRSTSMQGTRTKQVDRAVGILGEALDLPFTSLDIVGFQSYTDGEATLTRFSKTQTLDDDMVGGNTPTHIALQYARNFLRERRGSRYLMLLTDGVPYWGDKSGRLAPAKLRYAKVRDAFLEAKADGIDVATLLVGSDLPTGPVFDAKIETIEYMYGARKFWQLVGEQDLAMALIDLVSRTFVRHLRSC